MGYSRALSPSEKRALEVLRHDVMGLPKPETVQQFVHLATREIGHREWNAGVVNRGCTVRDVYRLLEGSNVGYNKTYIIVNYFHAELIRRKETEKENG